MRIIWNFLVLLILVAALFVIMNLINSYFGLPVWVKMEFIENVLKRLWRQ